MAVERTDLNDDADKIAKEQQEREERQAALEKKLRDEEIARARAESALEESRRYRETPSNQGVTEDQWQAMETETGMTRQQIQANAKLMSALVETRTKPLSEQAEAAAKRAERAEQELEKIKSRGSLDKVESSFYDKNPVLKNYKADVEKFMAEFPDSDKVDAKTYERRLGLAADFVKGRVKETRTMRRNDDTRSSRIENNDDNSSEEVVEEFDPTGTGNESAAHLMRRVLNDWGKDARDEESIKVWKESLDPAGKGVEISSKEDVEKVKTMLKKGGTLKV